MRISFTIKRPTEDVSFHRGGQTVTLRLESLPLGWRDHLQAVFPEEAPAGYLNGKPTTEADPEWAACYGYLLLAKALESSEVLESKAPAGRGRAEWKAYALAVRGEFRDAGFTDSQIVHLLSRLTAIEEGGESPEEQAGNG